MIGFTAMIFGDIRILKKEYLFPIWHEGNSLGKRKLVTVVTKEKSLNRNL
jgi:hypothetical protein